MRKHFLILMLLALLPLASFAGDITILPANLQYYWGDANIPTVQGTAKANMIAPVGDLPVSARPEDNGAKVTVEQIAAALTFIPRATINKPDTYSYGLVLKDGYNVSNKVDDKETNPLAGHTIYVSGGDGQLKILKTPITAEMIDITAQAPFVFKNDVWKPEFTVTGNGITSNDYTYTWGGTITEVVNNQEQEVEYDNIHAGYGVIIVTAKNSDDCFFGGSAYVKFPITPLALNNITVADISDKTYSGADIVPDLNITCTVGDNTNYELRSADFSANYADNQNVGQATITIADKDGGDFTFDDKVVHFNIVPLSVKDNPAFEIKGQVQKTYTGEALTQDGNANLKVYWKKLADQEPVDVTDHFGFTYSNNVNVGMAAIKATAKPNDNTIEPAYVNNFKDDFSSTFAIIPQALNADGLNLQINLLKRNTLVEDENDPNAWVEATYEYEGREIKPGKIAADGKVVVTTGVEETFRTLKENTDYVIVEDGYANNINASTDAAEENKPVLKIKGIGNYDAVDTNGDPIVISKKFEINKRTLKFEAVTPITTSYGVEPKDTACTDNIVKVEGVKEDIGGKITYEIYDNNTTPATKVVKNALHPNAYKELVVSTDRYTYVPVWKANPYPDEPDGGWTDENPAPDPANYDKQNQVAARANYNIDAIQYTEGVIKVTNAVLYVVVDNLTKKYGSTDPDLTYKVHAGSAEGEVVATSTELPDGYWSVAPVLERTEGENVKKNAQDPTKYDGYTIAVTNKVAHDQVAAVAKDNYEIKFVDGALTINPFRITVTANNQTILYGNQPNKETLFNSMVKTVNVAGEEVDGDQVTVIFSPAQTGNQHLIDRAVLNLKLDVANCDGTVKTHKGVLVPSIENDNFIATPVCGDLTIKASNILVLKQDAEDLPGDIAAAAASGTAKTVKFGSRTLKADTWYTMVLPFTVKATELVNVMNDGAGNQVFTITNRLDKATKTGNIVFKLEMKEIPANEPFLIKTAEDVDLEDVVFSNKSIVYKTAAPESPAFDSNKLIGTYANIKIQCPAGSNMLKWLVNKETEKPSDPGTYYDVNNWKSPRDYEAPINALEAYLYENRTVPAANANAVHPTIITVEDFDGQTTSIKTLNAETMKAYAAEGWYTLDGIKLQSAPTEKGVYINNGKKVVLK